MGRPHRGRTSGPKPAPVFAEGGASPYPTKHRLLARILPSNRTCSQAPPCSPVSRRAAPVSAKGQEGNTWGCAATGLCRGRKAATDNTYVQGHGWVPRKPHYGH